MENNSPSQRGRTGRITRNWIEHHLLNKRQSQKVMQWLRWNVTAWERTIVIHAWQWGKWSRRKGTFSASALVQATRYRFPRNAFFQWILVRAFWILARSKDSNLCVPYSKLQKICAHSLTCWRKFNSGFSFFCSHKISFLEEVKWFCWWITWKWQNLGTKNNSSYKIR